MFKSGVKSVLVIGMAFAFAGCGGSTGDVIDAVDAVDEAAQTVDEAAQTVDEITQTVDDVTEAVDTVGGSELSQELKDSITYMFNEERLAKDVYLAINEVQSANQLSNIANNSETQHIDAVDQLAVKYDLNVTLYPDTEEPYASDRTPGVYAVEHIQELYNLLYEKGIQSKRDALEVGCMVEVVDIDDLNAYIVQAQASNASDIEEVFVNLRDGSYKHYWAFDKGLKDLNPGGNGCCDVENILEYEFCHPEYPNTQGGGGH